MIDFSEIDVKRMASGGTLSPESPVRRIYIRQPKVQIRDSKAILLARIELGDIQKEVQFSTDEEFAPYLCHERSDAFLIGLLSLAMRERCDIYCDVPVTKELLHQLRTELIPALCKYDTALYPVKIHAEGSDEPLPSAGKIGTGCSCGVDSLYAIRSLTEDPDYSIDYLTLNNVGAYTLNGHASMQRFADNAENARSFAAKHGYKLILTDSNFSEAFPQNHLCTHLYSSIFAVYALRKLWKRYYYASTGCDLQNYFALHNNHLYDSAKYDLIALPALSIPSLRICNQGADCSRFEKIAALADYQPATTHLNVCLQQGKGNCGLCSKCMRTLWILDALGKLENFSKVFDVVEYRTKRKERLKKLYEAHLDRVVHIDEAYEILKDRITPAIRREARRDWARQHPSRLRKLVRKVKRLAKQLLGRD